MKDMIRGALSALGVRKVMLATARAVYPPADPWVRQVRIGETKFLVLANEDVGRRVAFLGGYEPRDAGSLCGFIREEDICMDVGANTGYYTLLMAGKARRGRVFSFEPTALNFHLVSAAVHLNGFGHVTCERCAVGDRDGTVQFSESIDGAYSSLIPVGRSEQARSVEVEMLALDSYVERAGLPRVDVLKVDVEGAEGLVLRGAHRLLSDRGAQPRVIMLELVEENLHPYGESVVGLIRHVEALGYSANVAEAVGDLRPFRLGDEHRHHNILFVSTRP